jgi:hypothetical protein
LKAPQTTRISNNQNKLQMKHASTFTSLVLLLTLSLTATAQNQKIKSKAQQTAMTDGKDLPYTARVSSNFEMGDSKYARLVLNAWKAYDNNAFDSFNDFVADTVTAYMPDGTVIKGKENFIKGVKEYRGGFTNVKSEIDAWLPVKSLDIDREIVCIWGTETATKSDGTIQKLDLHELWFFNREGKLVFMRQFATSPPKM